MATNKDFIKLARLQRGKPEAAMLKVQMSQISQLYGYILEHAGDLIHRMSEDPSFFNGGFEYVSEKVKRCLRYLKNNYGFLKEVKEQIASNLKYEQKRGKLLDETYESQFTKLIKLSRKFADEHRKLPAYNDAHRITKRINVALGNWKFKEAIKDLEIFQRYLKLGEEAWKEFALEGLEGVDFIKFSGDSKVKYVKVKITGSKMEVGKFYIQKHEDENDNIHCFVTKFQKNGSAYGVQVEQWRMIPAMKSLKNAYPLFEEIDKKEVPKKVLMKMAKKVPNIFTMQDS